MTPLDHDDCGPANGAGPAAADVSFDVDRSRTSPGEPADVATERPGAAAPRAGERTLLAPSALAAAYLAIAAAFGPGAFDAARAGIGRFRAFALLGTLLIVAGAGTARLYEDARRVRRRGGDWMPNPRSYLFGGAAALLFVRVAQFAVGSIAPARPVPYVVGNAAVALALSSIVAGPVYAAMRRRRGDP